MFRADQGRFPGALEGLRRQRLVEPEADDKKRRGRRHQASTAAATATPSGQPVLLDAWVVLAAYEGAQPATGALNEVLDTNARPIIGAADFAEICDALGHLVGWLDGIQRPEYLRDVLAVDAPGAHTAAAAGWIRHAYRMSMVDAFAAATAMAHDAELWTGNSELLFGDRLWHALDLRDPHQRTATVPGLRNSTEFKRSEAATVVASALGRRRGPDPLDLDWHSPP